MSTHVFLMQHAVYNLSTPAGRSRGHEKSGAGTQPHHNTHTSHMRLYSAQQHTAPKPTAHSLLLRAIHGVWGIENTPALMQHPTTPVAALELDLAVHSLICWVLQLRGKTHCCLRLCTIGAGTQQRSTHTRSHNSTQPAQPQSPLTLPPARNLWYV